MNDKLGSTTDFRWSYLLFSTLFILGNLKDFFQNNVSDIFLLLLCNSLVPSLYFKQTFIFELRLKNFRSKQKNLWCELKNFSFSALFNTLQNWTFFFFSWSYASLQRPLFWICVRCLTQLCSQIEIDFIYSWFNCSYRAAPH